MAESAPLLHNVAEKNQAAADLLPIVYDELRQLAANLLKRKAPGQTFQPTALVHEAFVRLTRSKDAPCWENREHFFAAAARAMRWILVDAHRRKGVFQRIVANGHIGTPEECADPPMIDLIALDDALNQLALHDPIAAQVVELRYFAGLTLDEAAKILGVSRRAVTDKWAFARALLHNLLEGDRIRNTDFAGRRPPVVRNTM